VEIELLHNKKINSQRWNETVTMAVNSNFSAYTWYLDLIDPDWEGLLSTDYKYIFPIISSSKLFKIGFYQPSLYFRAGLYATEILSKEIFERFIDAIPDRISQLKVSLNKFNIFKNDTLYYSGISYQKDMVANIDSSVKYTAEAIQKLSVLLRRKLVVLEGMQISEFLKYYESYSMNKVSKWEQDFIRRLLSFTFYNRISSILGVLDEKNNLGAIGMFIRNQQRAWLYLYASSIDADKEGFFYYMLDYYVTRHSSLNIPLEFCDYKGIEQNILNLGATKHNVYNLSRTVKG